MYIYVTTATSQDLELASQVTRLVSFTHFTFYGLEVPKQALVLTQAINVQ